MSHLSFDLAQPDQVKLTARSQKLKRDPWSVVLRRRFNPDLKRGIVKETEVDLSEAPIIMAAVDISADAGANDALLAETRRLLASAPEARLACVNVLKQNRIALDTTLDEQGKNKHIERMAALRKWAAPLQLDTPRVTVHVLEEIDPASAILDFARLNTVGHILIGARRNSFRKKLLGSVSAKVAAEASCSVTVVRPAEAIDRSRYLYDE